MNAPTTPQPSDPINYWDNLQLRLYYTSNSDRSIDKNGAALLKKPATAAHEYVTKMQEDLIALGYLANGASNHDGIYGRVTKRAVLRFQRHAKRKYRLPQDAGISDLFTGQITGECNAATAAEIRKWIGKKWRIPIGRFKLVPLTTAGITGKMREDAARAWDQIVRIVTQKGGTLAGPYGDTLRPARISSKAGTSKYSFHYCGRAVDINQALGGGRGQRYYMAKENSGSDTFWRIWCKTTKQDGSQGVLKRKGEVKCFGFYNWTQYDIPKGYYVDLTQIIESTHKFERIKAQSGWNGKYNKTEWWHFQYKVDKQQTFQDEMELIGFSEVKLRAAGWNSNAMLDHAPG